MKIIGFDQINDNVLFGNIYGIRQNWTNIRGWSYLSEPRANHGFFCVLCENARLTLENGEIVDYHYGDILYLPKNSRYKFDFTISEERFGTILVNFDMFDRETLEDLAFNEIPIKVVSSATVIYTDDIYKIIDLYIDRTNNYTFIMSAFYNLLSHLSAHIIKRNEQKNYNNIYPAIKYINEHINDDTPIEDLAKMCMLSETGFRRLFKDYTGMQPSKYRMYARISKAKQMLSKNDLTISDIVAELNFYDKAYFYKIFTKTVGMTPLEYRNSIILNK